MKKQNCSEITLSECNNNNNMLLDNSELAIQFTNLLNNSEKLKFENKELKEKNKELLVKIDMQDKAIRELASLVNSIGKINLSLADLQNWLSTETSKRKSLLPGLLEIKDYQQQQQQQLDIQLMPEPSGSILKLSDSFDYFKGPHGILKYLVIGLSFCCFIISIFSSNCVDLNTTAAIRGFYLYVISSVFVFTLLFWVCMVSQLFKKLPKVNWILTDCIWSIVFGSLLFFGTICLSTNTCGFIGLIICLVLSGITSILLLLNGFYLYTKIKEVNLMNSNKRKILWKKTIDNEDKRQATKIVRYYDHSDEHKQENDFNI